MYRRTFLQTAASGVAGGMVAGAFGTTNMLAQAPPQPLSEPHFPDSLHQFVWRNWELANLDRMAAAVGGRPEALEALGRSMGLPEKPRLNDDQLRRVYVTVIRQNWHLLPNDQLIELLNWDEEEFAFTLKEDDFLDIKLGPKPQLDRVVYADPSGEARRRAREIAATVRRHLGDATSTTGEPAFAFVKRLSDPSFPVRRDPAARPSGDQVDLSSWSLRGSDGVDPRIVKRFEDYLRQAHSAPVGRDSERTIELVIDPQLSSGAEHFIVTVEDQHVEVVGGDTGSLLQAVYWLQDQMADSGGPFLSRGRTEKKAAFDPRHVYSFFALYGDPLLQPEIDPFPAGYLEKLGQVGMNGVWMQCVLSTMAPSKTFPEFGEGSERRLATLNSLVQRAKQFGMKIFLYINEPRTQRPEFFQHRPEMRGAKWGNDYAMCTAVPEVREWISDSLAHVFDRVPELGGVFSITMSENMTNCFSKYQPESCPRCSRREPADGVGEVLHAIYDGVRRSSSDAEVIAWDWGWRGEWADKLVQPLIPKLPDDMRFQSVSEWDIPVDRGGVQTKVGEYSMSVVGPGERALNRWALARQSGVAPMAKTQFNNTWEMSAVPYIPVANLVARHCEGLVDAGVTGVQASWTLGGYPSPNLEIAKAFSFASDQSSEAILDRVARRRYGEGAAPLVREAWSEFSDAFQEFPYGVSVYVMPTQHGPANLLRAEPTGVRSTMILFPQDNVRTWCGAYPPPAALAQFQKLANRWEQAMPTLREAVSLVPDNRKRGAEEDLAIAEMCATHFRSVANQIEFYILRDGEPTEQTRQAIRNIVENELELAKRLYPIVRDHSVLAYEASNHYYYRPNDLAEKILNCQYLLDHVYKV